MGAENARTRDEARKAVAGKNRRAHEKAARTRKAADQLKAEMRRGLEM